ncbi:MAG TPA: protein-L-isoaspartate(D-aspartate) O-methyltransferase [Polyangiales bacterium]|nr:protein-L-isoaspartate(D-aspartate) O-methyltransferase [Polyangiales bacterium]
MPNESVEPESSEVQRARMIERQLRRRDIHDEAVLAAMFAVPREAFVPESRREKAYYDNALPIGFEQTISQPYMVARAAELARLSKRDRVLDVGLGSGYQAAVLSRLCAQVIGIEIVPELAERARKTLEALGFDNVSVRSGDGSLGLPESAPYDAILVAAGAPRVPDALIEQLRIGGRLVIPVGDVDRQTLTVVTRTAYGHDTVEYDGCVYVPLRGAAGRA